MSGGHRRPRRARHLVVSLAASALMLPASAMAAEHTACLDPDGGGCVTWSAGSGDHGGTDQMARSRAPVATDTSPASSGPEPVRSPLLVQAVPSLTPGQRNPVVIPVVPSVAAIPDGPTEGSRPGTARREPGSVPLRDARGDGGPFLPYSADSFFRSTVAGKQVDTAGTQSFRAFMASYPAQRRTRYPLIRGVGGNRWGTVFAQGHTDDPVWRLTGRVPAAVSFLTTAGFHAPEYFGDLLTGTSDSPFVVLDRAGGMSVWGAKAHVVRDHLVQVGSAGAFMHGSNGLDRRNPLSDSSVNYRSRGAIPDSMVIRPDRMAWAIENKTDLGYVLHLFIAESNSSAGHVSPMVGHESGKGGWGAQGQRIAVDPDVDLASRKCTPAARALARTLQVHGAYVGDNSGSETGLKAAQESGGRVWGGSLHARELDGCVTWSDFVVIRSG